ncbi:lysine N(6)-hydroxylase/L-ornithine N(5)-oxygenase family protein [Thermoactinomyces sp. DSM 45892]|uniref:lysine N(6)-hydroxylase/L-ornithine N(5)-oxygenase family protein n=1 Tax=Thermoactinomyces sp. DSM 45892 TaxID=1882753 RepID=UPI00089A60A2|nr:lysine N(6)-hydroxylase/L-ornithine N(5)-oxygenase family protein [Thermoactinomyces sp. DSM 45892]SDY02066.1 lysine N6-hydroxylase [Thermoactinomyces sp. DSM 45892]
MQSNTLYDVIGVGLGPFNLGLASLLDPVKEVNALFLEQKPEFAWHPGLLIENTTLQVPFLADLVTMADPTSPYSYLNYLRHQKRLYHFYFLEHFHVPRKEYSHYCQWVSKQLHSCQFGKQVIGFEFHQQDDPTQNYYEVCVRDTTSKEIDLLRCKHLVLGIGTAPIMDERFQQLSDQDVFHSSLFLEKKKRCQEAKKITVIGSGQSAAEVFLTLFQDQPNHTYELNWYTRSNGFFPMEYSKLGLEHFSPDYTRYFYSLSQEKKDVRRSKQDLLYKGISASTIADIYDLYYERTIGGQSVPVTLQAMTTLESIEPRFDGTYELTLKHTEQEIISTHQSDVVILSTGYASQVDLMLHPFGEYIQRDEKQRPIIQEDYQIATQGCQNNRIYIQNGELHSHGIGAPDLGLGAYRNSVIINSLLGSEVYPVQEKNVFQQFGTARIPSYN